MTVEGLPTEPRARVHSASDRWVPSRAGLVNVWQFGNEILDFERGRLVLYGPNGSGKTMALELLLPYLLDANGQPGRLSTSGADRGGLWDRVTGYSSGGGRTGYLWLEFLRPTGQAFTIGVRLRAKPTAGGDKHWFTTSQRVGRDLELIDHGRPLTVEQLRETLANAGNLWGPDTEGYRNAVRTTLFPGWSADRLDALITTLLEVRKQHVTDGLSPMALSQHLSDALPPLDDGELGKVADGFADLDRRRDDIGQLEEDVVALNRIVRVNREYARAVVGRATTAVSKAQTAFDNVTRRVRKLSDERDRLITRRQELDARAASLGDEDAALDERLQGLHASDAYKQGGQLNLLRQQVQHARQQAESGTGSARHEEEVAGCSGEAARAARSDAETAARETKTARIELEQTAALLGTEFIELEDRAVVGACEVWIEARDAAILEVRKALEDHVRALDVRTKCTEDRDRCEEALTDSEARLAKERKAAEKALAVWRSDVRRWTFEASEVGPHVVESTLEEPGAAMQMVGEARRLAEEPLVRHGTQLERVGDGLARELVDARAEREEWAAGRDPEPANPPNRRSRDGLPGAPFWRLVQFRDLVDDGTRGRIEAALADSRVLDGWVTPDGALALEDDTSDILVRPPDVIAEGATLAGVLEPDPAQERAPHSRVDELLRSIRLVDAGAHENASGDRILIGRDGTWRTDRLAARAVVGPAQFIGASSRAAARAARIAELDEKIGELERVAAENAARRADVDRRLKACEAECRTFPSPQDVLQADRVVERGEIRTQLEANALAEACKRLDEASRRVQERFRALSVAATRHELPTDAETLDVVTGSLRTLRRQASAFEHRRVRAAAADALAVTAAEQAQAARERANVRRAEARNLERTASALAARFREVDAAVGADYREIVVRIEAVTSRRREVRQEIEVSSADLREVAGKLGEANSQLSSAEQARTDAERERNLATDRFVAATAAGLLAAAEVPDPPGVADLPTFTAILDAVRRIRAWGSLDADADDARIQRLSNNVVKQVADAERQLMGRADLTFETTDHGWSVVRARRDGALTSAHDLQAGLRADLEIARSELTRKQQELFEQILSGSLREHLRDRLWAAQALVDRINDILGLVRTAASGVRVRLKWEIDDEHDDAAELRRAKELLLRDSPLAEGRKELDTFLQARIERIRSAEDDTGQWRDRLAEMLNYRAWHRFYVMVHHKRFGEEPRRLESRKVSLSAGEKTIVMVLPLLAAVTSHYEPAPGEPAGITPRLLLMDELFPKVDYPNKRQLLQLLPVLDLDAVFTSDKDRCEYDTIDGIAIHVFQKLEDDSSTTTRLVWNGTGLQVTEPLEEQAASLAE